MKQNFINYSELRNVAILELDDPSANTLTYHLLKELEERVFHIATNTSIRGIVIIGKGEKFFSGGVNIGMLLTAGRQHNSHFILFAAEVLELIESLPISVVTIINGNITGGGLELALIADYRIAIAGSYNIGFPEVRLGVIPGMGGTQRLARLVGPQRALEMITQGEFISPSTSLDIGLIDVLLPLENFRENAIGLAIDYIHQHSLSQTKGLPISWLDKSTDIDDVVQLSIDKGLAVIHITAAANTHNSIDILIALNEYLLDLRTDDEIYSVLIDLKSECFGKDDNADFFKVHETLFRYIFNKISGYPRIVALNVHGSLQNIAMELALHCDYRLVDLTLATSKLTSKLQQNINSDSPEYERFRPFFNSLPAISSIADLVSSGFYRIQDKPQEWLMRFVPPIGAGQAIGYAKLAITKGYKEPLSSSLLLERHLQEQLFMSHDSKEGMTAYVEKRKPFFTGA